MQSRWLQYVKKFAENVQTNVPSMKQITARNVQEPVKNVPKLAEVMQVLEFRVESTE